MKEFSGDEHLTKRERIKYLFFNFMRGLSGYNTFLKTKYWRPQRVKKMRDSPGREYSNEFLYENLSELLPTKEIKVLDIGCGSGYVRKIFYNLGQSLFYTGVDIKKNKRFEEFSKYALDSNFIQSKIEEFNTENKYNLVFSISALEHIENDILAVSKTSQFLEKGGIQTHIVPTFWSLFLYLCHGYRQYTPARLKRLFRKEEFEIYRLGGLFSFFLHLFFITIPEALLRNTKPRQLSIYPKLLNIANRFDCFFPIFSSVYVVITKNENQKKNLQNYN